MGYYQNPKATREAFTSDGWFRTGDLGYYDDEGFFFVIDRLKELIKFNGFQVAPAELEAIVLRHPKVQDVGVVGLEDERVGERPVAFVVKKEGCQLTGAELKDYVAGEEGLVNSGLSLGDCVELQDWYRPKNACLEECALWIQSRRTPAGKSCGGS